MRGGRPELVETLVEHPIHSDDRLPRVHTVTVGNVVEEHVPSDSAEHVVANNVAHPLPMTRASSPSQSIHVAVAGTCIGRREPIRPVVAGLRNAWDLVGDIRVHLGQVIG